MTGLHGVHVLVGMGLIFWILVRSSGPRDRLWLIPAGVVGAGTLLLAIGIIARSGWTIKIAAVIVVLGVASMVQRMTGAASVAEGPEIGRLFHSRRSDRVVLAHCRPDLDLPLPVAVSDSLKKKETMSTAQTLEHDSRHDSGAVHVHVMPPSVLLTVYAVLVCATIATVAVTLVDLGFLNIWAALIIAVFKAALVILYFMHLRYDSLFNGIILIAAIGFVMVFISVALMDTSEYKSNYQPPGTRQMMSSQNGL